MKKLLNYFIVILLFTAFSNTSSFAQIQDTKFDFELGKKQKRGIMESYPGLINSDETGYYMLRSKTKGNYGIIASPQAELFIDHFDHDLNLINSEKIKGMKKGLLDNPSKTNFEFILKKSDNNLFVFYSRVDKDKKVDLLYKARLNKNSLELETPELVHSSKLRPGFKDRRGTYDYAISEDNSKVVITSILGKKTKANTYALIYVMNSELNLIYKKECSMPYSFKNAFSYITSLSKETVPFKLRKKKPIVVNNDGTVHLLIKVENRKTKRKTYHVTSFKESVETFVKNKIQTPELYPMDMIMSLQDNGDLCCAGVNSKSKVFRNFDRLSYVVISGDSLGIKKHKLLEPSAEQKNSFSTNDKNSKKTKKSKKTGQFYFVDFIKHENGELTLIGEPYRRTSYTETKSTNAGMSRSTKEEFTFKDIYLFHLDSQGNIQWVKTINKYQKSEASETLSFFHYYQNDKIMIIYNDLKTKYLRVKAVSCNGEIEDFSDIKINSKDSLGGYYFIPTSCKSYNHGESIAYAIHLFKTRLIRFSTK